MKFQSQKITNNNQHNILTMILYACDIIMHDDVIICDSFIRNVFEITKIQTEPNISQHLGKFACCYKNLMVLMTSSSFSLRHNLKRFIFKNLIINSFNKQKISILSLTNRFLDREANLPPPIQIRCKNSPVYIGLMNRSKIM